MPAVAVAIGAMAGVFSGMLGIGGGAVLTPALRLLGGLTPLAAVGTSLAAVVPTAVAGAWSHHRAGSIDLRTALAAGGAGALTAVAGSWAGSRLGDPVVTWALALVVLWSAVSMIADSGRGDGRRPPAAGAGWRSAAPFGAGAFAGLVAGLVGVGGGLVMVPVFRRFLRMPTERAVATSLAAVPIVALPAAVTHAALGHVEWMLAGLLLAGLVPGALAGAALTRAVPERLVRGVFAAFMLTAGVWLVADRLAG